MSLSPATPGSTRIGWIGAGVMGSSMCGHLLDAGFSATVFNRTRAKAEALLARGARWADSPRAVAEAADVIFTIVGYPADVRSVILGDCPNFRPSENGTVPSSEEGDSPVFADTKTGTVPGGVLAGCRAGSIIVDMTTSQPSLAVEIAAAAAAIGVHALDAPVSGGDVGAREARLSIMVGGDEAAFQAVLPCFQAMGKTIVRQGGPGAGQHTKMVNQITIASNMVGICEALLYAYRAGLDLDAVLQSIASGAAGSWSLQNLGPRIIQNRFEPGFFVEHFIKDMGIALDEAKRMGLALPGLALAHQLYVSLQAHGHGRDGTHALHLALAEMSNIDWIGRGAGYQPAVMRAAQS